MARKEEIMAFIKHVLTEPIRSVSTVSKSLPKWLQLKTLFHLTMAGVLISLLYRRVTIALSFLVIAILAYLTNEWFVGAWRQELRCKPCWQQTKKEMKYLYRANWVKEEYLANLPTAENPTARPKSREQIVYEHIHNNRCVTKVSNTEKKETINTTIEEKKNNG